MHRGRTAVLRAPATSMTPELRAIADRFIYEQATLKLIVALAPPDAPDRPVPGYEWTVRQLMAHLAESLHSYQAVIKKWLAGKGALDDWNPERLNAATAARHAASSPVEIVALFGSGLVGLIATLEAMPDERLSEPLGPGKAIETVKTFGEHFLSHAISLVNAVPEVRMDPLVLNWLLYAGFNDEASNAWQASLLADAKEYIATHPHEEDDDE